MAYLPIADITLRMMFTTTLSSFIVSLLPKLKARLTVFVYCCERMLHNYSENSKRSSVSVVLNYLRQFRLNYVTIQSDTCEYHTMIKYITNNFIDKVSGQEVLIEHGSKFYDLRELSNMTITDIYVSDKGQSYEMHIAVEEKEDTSSKKNTNKLKISSSCTNDIIRMYIEFIHKKMDTESTQNKNLAVYKITKGFDDKGLRLKECSTTTSKNLSNIVLSEKVRTDLLDDIDTFINSENFYDKRGLSYKRGYLLYGPPGTGKTSIIKAITKYYNLPLFIIDLDIFTNNSEFLQIMEEINVLCSFRKHHIVLFEDIDRTALIKRLRYSISEDALLNVLDGINDNKGRITFITANTIENIVSINGLIRPGRIDRKVNISHCTEGQIQSAFQLYYGIDEHLVLLPNIIITPASLIQLFQYKQDYNDVVQILNYIRNFENKSIDDIVMKPLEEVSPIVNSKNISTTNVFDRDQNSQYYDKIYLELLQIKDNITKYQNNNMFINRRRQLELSRLELDYEDKLLRVEEFRENNNIVPLVQLDNLSYKEISEKYMTLNSLNYEKLI